MDGLGPPFFHIQMAFTVQEATDTAIHKCRLRQNLTLPVSPMVRGRKVSA
jgi:hypothetical protein